MGTTKKCKCGEYKNRPVAVDAVILRKNEVLLIKRGIEPEQGKWALPGGHIDWDESAEEALRREVEEEGGLKVRHARLVGVQSSPKRLRQIVAIYYLVRVEGESHTTSEAREVKWFSVLKLPENMAFDHSEIIKKTMAII